MGEDRGQNEPDGGNPGPLLRFRRHHRLLLVHIIDVGTNP